MKLISSTSRYLDDLLNIGNSNFEGIVNQNPLSLQFNKANTSDTGATFWIYLCLFLTVLFYPKFMKSVTILLLVL